MACISTSQQERTMSFTLTRLSPLFLSVALVVAAAVPPLTAQAQTVVTSSRAPMIKGSGKVVEQNRTVSAFSKIRLEGSFTIEAQQGNRTQVSVRADDNLTDHLETVVENSTLVVRGTPKVSWRTSSPMVVRVTFQELQAAELSGSGDFNIHDLKTERFAASVSGSGDMRVDKAQVVNLQARLAGSGDLVVTGSADTVEASLAGSGDIDLQQLMAKKGSVKLAGSGDLNVHASESVSVSLVGSGDVRVYGRPATVNRQVVGGGNVHMQ
jgi:hypothetical protein